MQFNFLFSTVIDTLIKKPEFRRSCEGASDPGFLVRTIRICNFDDPATVSVLTLTY